VVVGREAATARAGARPSRTLSALRRRRSGSFHQYARPDGPWRQGELVVSTPRRHLKTSRLGVKTLPCLSSARLATIRVGGRPRAAPPRRGDRRWAASRTCNPPQCTPRPSSKPGTEMHTHTHHPAARAALIPRAWPRATALAGGSPENTPWLVSHPGPAPSRCTWLLTNTTAIFRTRNVCSIVPTAFGPDLPSRR